MHIVVNLMPVMLLVSQKFATCFSIEYAAQLPTGRTNHA